MAVNNPAADVADNTDLISIFRVIRGSSWYMAVNSAARDDADNADEQSASCSVIRGSS